MKFKVTKKEINSQYNRIIGIGYCDLQFLLKYEYPIAYSTRIEGWACDYYDINGILISTGYSHLEDKNIKHDYNLIREYDNKAQKIIFNHDLEYENKKNQVKSLLNEFISKCIE